MLHIALSAFIAFLLPLSFIGSLFFFRGSRRPNIGRVGQILGGLLFFSMGAFLAVMTFIGIKDQLIHCFGFGRTCGESYSMVTEPSMFWFTSIVWYAGTVFMLAAGIFIIRQSFLKQPSEP